MNAKKLFALALIVPVLSGSFVWGADEPSNIDTVPRKPYVAEAAEAVVGRVFGVEGEASDIKYHVIELTQHSPGNAALRSLFVPGWGQHFNSQRVKGSIFFITTMGALIGSAHLYNQSKSKYDDYLARGEKDADLYDDYQNDRTRSLIFGGAAALLWVIGVVDAYRNAYQPLYSKNPNVELTFSDDKTSIFIRKNF